MTRLALLLASFALFAPPAHAALAPDPPPQACQGGWCRVPTVSDRWIGPLHLPGRAGLWTCHLTARPTMKCRRVSP